MGKPPLSFIEPMQPALVDATPDGSDWIHEVKWDGYRSQIIVQNGTARIFTRRGHDWTKRYAPIASEVLQLPGKTMIIDGEIILADPAGASDFAGLPSVIANHPDQLTFVAFDLLHFGGVDLRFRPLVERRELLEDLIGKGGDRIQFSQTMPGTGAQIFHVVESAGLEGIVSKRASSRYRSGRTRDWLKTKAFEEGEFELLGVKREQGKPPTALLARGGKHIGNAFIALPPSVRERFWQWVEEHPGPRPKSIRPRDLGNAIQWLQPGMVGRVRFLKGETALRHATLRDWREHETQT